METRAGTAYDATCPAREVLELIASKWTVLVVDALSEASPNRLPPSAAGQTRTSPRSREHAPPAKQRRRSRRPCQRTSSFAGHPRATPTISSSCATTGAAWADPSWRTPNTGQTAATHDWSLSPLAGRNRSGGRRLRAIGHVPQFDFHPRLPDLERSHGPHGSRPCSGFSTVAHPHGWVTPISPASRSYAPPSPGSWPGLCGSPPRPSASKGSRPSDEPSSQQPEPRPRICGPSRSSYPPRTEARSHNRR
jgi:hypothetical protein